MENKKNKILRKAEVSENQCVACGGCVKVCRLIADTKGM